LAASPCALIIAVVKGVHVTTVLQRVCWNTDAWRKASGETVDSGNPGKHGYGNEEWNFCTEDALDGNVFGWLYWPAKKFTGKHFQILFWTIRPPMKDWILVGAYHDASLATQNDLRKLGSFFRQEKIGKRRLAEVLSAVERPDHKRYAKKHPPTNAKDLKFKCPKNKVEIFQPYYSYKVLPKKFQSKNPRFKNPTIFEESISTLLKDAGKKFRARKDYVADPLVEDVYPRATAASLKVIVPRHKKLCNDFIGWLDDTGRKVLGREKNRVDVEFKDGSNFCRAELKTCYGITPRFALREALGQLLEYNYYGWRTTADRWFIVLDLPPSEHDLEYVRTLSMKKKLPLVLCWKSGTEFVEAPSSPNH
jgi:hypothetical protein